MAQLNDLLVNGQSTFLGPVQVSGRITAQSFNAISDVKLKENIVKFESSTSILDLPIYKYDYVDGKKNQIGCLAHELKEICPEIVEENENGYLSIQESKIVYLLIDEIKKLKGQINSLMKGGC